MRTLRLAAFAGLAALWSAQTAWAAIAFEEEKEGSASSSSSVTTSAALTNVNGHLYLAAVGHNDILNVTSVSGMGLTWTELIDFTGHQDKTGVALYWALGNGGSNGTVTGNVASSINNLVIIVCRYSGVDTNNPVGTASGTAADTANWYKSLTTTVANAWAYAADVNRMNYEVVSVSNLLGHSQRGQLDRGGNDANAVTVTVVDQLRASTGTYNTGFVWSGSTKLGVVVVEIKPSTNSAPTAPTTPYSNDDTAQSGQANPTNLSDPTPAFSAIYNDPDSGDIANKYRVEVNTASDFTGTVMWDSGSSGTSMSNTTAGNRCPDITYAGSALANNTTYYWRIRFWDDDNTAGTVSATQQFTTLTLAKGLQLESSSGALGLESSSGELILEGSNN